MSTIGHWQIDASSGMPKHSQGGDNSGRRFFQACNANCRPPIRSNNSITSCLWNLKPKEACYGQVFYFLFSFPRVHAVLFISQHCSDFILAFKCVHTGAISYVSSIIFHLIFCNGKSFPFHSWVIFSVCFSYSTRSCWVNALIHYSRTSHTVHSWFILKSLIKWLYYSVCNS